MPEHTAQIRHETTEALDPATLAELKKQLGDFPQVIAFYETFGSLRLYGDTIAKEAGYCAAAFYIAHPDEWAELKERAESWFDMLDDFGDRDEFSEWIADYVVIGEIPNSGNCFLMPLQGEHRGKVFEFEHDGFEFIERGGNMEEFVNNIATVTDKLLDDISCHTRYCDGNTQTQWMPTAYLHD